MSHLKKSWEDMSPWLVHFTDGIPEESHEAARSFFNDAETENLGPNYQCPYVDPLWDLGRLKSELPNYFQ
jgi:hypothetical protein